MGKHRKNNAGGHKKQKGSPQRDAAAPQQPGDTKRGKQDVPKLADVVHNVVATSEVTDDVKRALFKVDEPPCNHSCV